MIQVNRHRLSNGLQLVHSQNSATAMVALNILYKVGARDEHPDRTGMAHLFEHLMFGGSRHVADFDKEMEKAGGTNNAWTNSDFTNFYDIMPAQNAETAFWLESDRMNELSFSDKALEVQRHVVMEEFKQVCLNQPYGDLHHHLNALAYTTHPYRYPVIGKELSHIEKVTLDDIRSFFYSHYAPNNAIVAVTGNISFERAKELTEKWFASLPARSITPALYNKEPQQISSRRLEVEGRVPQTVIVKAFHMASYGEKEYFAADVITDLLAAGKASRFYRDLLMSTNLYTKVDASITGSEDEGLLLLRANLRPDADISAAEEVLMAGAKSLITSPPSSNEMERAFNRFESVHTFGTMNYASLATTLCLCEAHGEDINSIVERQRSVTVDDVINTSRLLFREENCSTLIYRPLSAQN